MSGAHSEKKVSYFAKLERLAREFNKVLIVHADNVGSKQMQTIRMSLRGKAEILMGKNTMIRKCLRSLLPENPALEKLLPLLRGNVGMIFTSLPPSDIRAIVNETTVAAPAKAGATSTVNVTIPAGPTTLEPTQTAFFQALNIGTKITKGMIEILNNVQLLKIGEKVGPSQAILLKKLNIMPFNYGLNVLSVYDNGAVYGAAVLDITAAQIRTLLTDAIATVAAIGIKTKQPTLAAAPHSIVHALKDLIAVSLGTDYDFKEAQGIKKLLSDPNAMAALAAAAAPKAAAAAPAAAGKAAPAPKKETSEEEGGAFGLFD